MDRPDGPRSLVASDIIRAYRPQSITPLRYASKTYEMVDHIGTKHGAASITEVEGFGTSSHLPRR